MAAPNGDCTRRARPVSEAGRGPDRDFAAEGESTIDIGCECSDLACIEPIPVPIVTYERVRADAALFFVKPGHELPTVEDVHERARAYLIVRKRAEAMRPAGAVDLHSN